MLQLLKMAVIGGTLTASSFAGVILGNLGGFSVGFNLDHGTNLAAGFTMGATSVTLTQAQVQFFTVGIASFADTDVFADIYGGTGGVPGGASLLSLTVSAPGGVIQNNIGTLTPQGSLVLQAGTGYLLGAPTPPARFNQPGLGPSHPGAAGEPGGPP